VYIKVCSSSNLQPLAVKHGLAFCQAKLAFAGYLMPEEQMAEEEEDEDDEMDEEYTPEMADELMRRGLILGGGLISMPCVFKTQYTKVANDVCAHHASMYAMVLR